MVKIYRTYSIDTDICGEFERNTKRINRSKLIQDFMEDYNERN